MFQYAAGRALSLERGVTWLHDTSEFSKYKLHQGFELQRVFNCPINIASNTDLQSVLGWQRFPLVRRLLSQPSIFFLRKRELIFEPYFHYSTSIIDAPNNCYLSGYWQSDKYFRKYSSHIRSDFNFCQNLSAENLNLSQKISQVNAVSVHIRRGDYIANSKTKSVLNSCTLEYYYAAINFLLQKIKNPYLFIFSDDISWTKNNLKVTLPCEFIENNQGQNSFVDMQLMSLCQHHIIANSSFSWWGAWLGVNPHKIVIAPAKWFVSGKRISKDLIAEGWLAI
jgi:hypothetical protein